MPLMDDARGTATRLLKEASAGDRRAFDELIRIVYDDLHSRAQAFMGRERRDHTLQPTALVGEAYLRLVRAEDLDWKDRSHFLAIAAKNMRQILAKHARGKAAAKRPPRAKRVALEEGLVPAAEEGVDASALEEALRKLEAYDSRMSRIVEMRYFGGMTVEEVAAVLDVDPRTVKRDWKAAKLFLLDELSEG
jgi:RNA polymerase sigma factor (TIGR02999 family)